MSQQNSGGWFWIPVLLGWSIYFFMIRPNLHNATQQQQYIPVPQQPQYIPVPVPVQVPQQEQICNPYGCGVSPNPYGASPNGVCTPYGCP